MNECEHFTPLITGSWGANAAAHLICLDCGQKHAMTDGEVERYTEHQGEQAQGAYLAMLLAAEDRLEDDPDAVHTD